MEKPEITESAVESYRMFLAGIAGVFAASWYPPEPGIQGIYAIAGIAIVLHVLMAMEYVTRSMLYELMENGLNPWKWIRSEA